MALFAVAPVAFAMGGRDDVRDDCPRGSHLREVQISRSTEIRVGLSDKVIGGSITIGGGRTLICEPDLRVQKQREMKFTPDRHFTPDQPSGRHFTPDRPPRGFDKI